MKKIAILGLHLGFGGVEQAIVNQANMLCEKYEVELVVTYKLNDKPAFAINPKVKVIYLTNLKPNKKEFMIALKSKKLMNTFKEGIKSIKILYLKKNSMKNYIKKSDADILISSRIEITELLNKYAKSNKITIAEEHRHHNNNQKYIKRLNKACSKIKYLLPVSEELTKFYKEHIKNVKCLYIPNSLDYWPKEPSKLNSKKVISVGRLSPEKGFLDLIEVFKIMRDCDEKLHLDIIGDGIEREQIEQKIKKYGLENSVTIHGFQSKKYINSYLEKSSLYLMCSWEESFGIVLIEAGSFGIPCIAFDSAQGAHEIIDDAKNGYLIANRDKNLMAKKAIELMNNNLKLKIFGKNMRESVKKYSFDNVKKKWLKFIERIIGE